MIDRLPMASSFSCSNWEKSQWDSECERDIATNASRHLPCKFLSPSGVTPSMYALPCKRLQLGDPKVHQRTMSVSLGLGPATQKASPHEPCSMGPSLSLLSREAIRPLRVVGRRVKGKEDGILRGSRNACFRPDPLLFATKSRLITAETACSYS